jgi:LysR family transcriptional regulator, glycine cleavage system transcriptional activator
MPPLRALQAFELVGRLGSAAEAARTLGLSPGAISQHINKLEEDIGVSLFERKGRSLILTSWGKLYLEKVSAGFERLRAAQDVLQRARWKAGIVFSAPPSLTIRWLRPLMREWQQQFPEVRVRLVGQDHEPVLEDEGVDFRISYGTARYKYAHFTDIFHDWAAPCCSPKFLNDYPIKSGQDILNAPLIEIAWENAGQSAPTWEDWASRFSLIASAEPCSYSFSLSSAAIDAAISEGGFFLGQHSLVKKELEAGRLVIAHPKWIKFAEPYGFAWNPASLDRPFALEFRNFIIQEGQKLRRFDV